MMTCDVGEYSREAENLCNRNQTDGLCAQGYYLAERTADSAKHFQDRLKVCKEIMDPPASGYYATIGQVTPECDSGDTVTKGEYTCSVNAAGSFGPVNSASKTETSCKDGYFCRHETARGGRVKMAQKSCPIGFKSLGAGMRNENEGCLPCD